jgi:nucleoside-diphosphate-sugar epimerase
MRAEPHILITGGGGFVGGRFAEVIYLTGFGRVRVGVRRWGGAARAARFPVDIALCDVLDSRQVAEAMQGVDVVIHCAVGDRQVIVEGTRNVLEAATRAGVSRVIHLSTAEVYGPVSGRVDETTRCAPTGSEYGDAKILAETVCWDHCLRGLPITIFRPSIVYGPWSDQWTGELAERLQSGCWGRYTRYGDGICNLVYVDDLVAIALSSIHQDKAAGQAFNVGGPETPTWNEYFDRLNAAIGLPPLPVRSAPSAKATSLVTAAVRAAAQAGFACCGGTLRRVYARGGWPAVTMKRVKRWLNTNPSPRELDGLYSRNAIYDWSKAKRLLGYRPSFDLDLGLRLSVDWLRHAGVVNGSP